jgi:general secretion pathway protein H
MTRRGSQRAATLIEILVAISIVALLAGGMFAGIGMVRRSRLREAATFVTSAVRVAYMHASSTSRPTRLVFDFANRTIKLEETDGAFYVQQDRTGGAAGATDLEKQALEEGEAIADGAKKARPEFHEVRRSTLDAVANVREGEDSANKSGKELPRGVSFRQIEVAHEDDPVTGEQVYLYFWPGGMTERAAIQLQMGDGAGVPADDVMTVSVKPLTGGVRIDNGPVEMDRPRGDDEDE